MRFRYGLIFLLALLFHGSLFPAQTRFSLVFNEGFGSMKIGDINTTLVSLNSAYDGLRHTEPGAVAGEYLPLPTRFKDWQVELRWNVWKGLSIGIAISGPMRFAHMSALTHTIFGWQAGLPQTMNNTLAYDINVSAPIWLNLFYAVPIISRVNFTAYGGVGDYSARIEETWSYVFRLPDNTSQIGNTYTAGSGKQMGCHGGIAFEYILNKRVSLVMAGAWRLAKIESFEGSYLSHGTSFDGNGVIIDTLDASMEGILIHYTGDADYIWGVRHEKIKIFAGEPPYYGADSPSDGRKALLDLSGFTLRIGLKIGLF